MEGKQIIITLDAHVDESNQLVVEYESYGSQITFQGLDDLTADLEDVTEVTLEIRDFVQNNTVYGVYGVVLTENRRSVAAYFTPMNGEVGQRYRFVLDDQERHPAIVIGAVPRRRDLAEPVALSTGGSFPVSTGGGKEKGSDGTPN